MILLVALSAWAFETSGADHLEIKWFRDSAEYSWLTEQVYKQATDAVIPQGRALGKKATWTVVLDIDETTLDTSAYWLELASYDQLFTWESWNAWCERRDAPTVPGVVAFVAAIRKAGGEVAWISNRHEVSRQATVDNLKAHGLWSDADRMCLLTDDDAYTKEVRRTQLRDGNGPCGAEGRPVQVVAYLGDAAGDFPTEAEGGPRLPQLGVRDFVLPNPMYGGWEHKNTRRPTSKVAD